MRALQAKGVEGKVISHIDLLTDTVYLPDQLSPDTTIRIETAGENFPVEKELIRLGARILHQGELVTDIDRMRFEMGKITYPSLWYTGWCRYLNGIGKQVAQSRARYMNDPSDIMLMFDKCSVHRLFSNAGIPVAKDLSPNEPVKSFDHLVALMTQTRIFRVFIKLRYGSGAMGIVAFSKHPSLNLFSAMTTLELVRTKGKVELYNTKTFFTYRRQSDIRSIVDLLCQEGVHVEQWIPKAYADGGPFDIRQVVIGGKATHKIARIGRGPFTNLHLRNRRKQIDSSWMSDSLIKKVEHISEATCALFKGSFYAGVDILIPRGSGNPRVLEINAFGDFVNQAFFQGKDPYALEVERWLATCRTEQRPSYQHETVAL